MKDLLTNVLYERPDNPIDCLISSLQSLKNSTSSRTSKGQLYGIPTISVTQSPRKTFNIPTLDFSSVDNSTIIHTPLVKSAPSRGTASDEGANSLQVTDDHSKQRRKSVDMGQFGNETKETHHIKMERSKDGVKMINQYIIKETLGKGTYATVKLAVDSITKETYVVQVTIITDTSRPSKFATNQNYGVNAL